MVKTDQSSSDTIVGGKPIRRLLAVNLNYLGDALFTTPALALLRTRFPDAVIDVLAGERGAAILAGNASVNEIFVRPRRGGARRVMACAQIVGSGSYDAAILFQSIVSNAAVVWACGAPIRLGFAQDGCNPFLTHRVSCRRPGEHIVDAYLRLADAVRPDGPLVSAPTPTLSVALGPDDRMHADTILRDRELVPPVVGLVVGATRPQKRWPEEYWARLADKLWSTANVSCVLLGGAEETGTAERILRLTNCAPLHSLVGRTTEKQLAAFVEKLGLVVSGDTGPLHIATAMGTPVIGLFGSTDPSGTGPWQGGANAGSAVILYDALSCAPCRKSPSCGGRFDCMRALTPERVFDAASRLLDLPTRRISLPMVAAAPVMVASEASLGGGPRA